MKFIKTIVAFSLSNKLFIFFMTAAVLVGGIVSYLDTPIEAYPDVTNTQIRIITQWPGRSAEEIEKFVTIPMEIAMNSVPKKINLRSTSLFGLSVVTLIFDDGIDDIYARAQVNNMLMNLTLPEGADPDVQPPYGPTGEIFRYTLRGKGMSARDLKTVQDWVVERKLKAVPGIADVVSFGGEVKCYEVMVDPNLLLKYDITPLQVYEALAKSNINVGGDIIRKNSQAYVVRGIGLLSSMEDIENLIIDKNQDAPVLIKNIGKVVESALPRLGQVARGAEKDVVEGIIVMRKGEDPTQVLEKLREKIKEINEKYLPKGVEMITFYDRGNLINMTTKTVLHNLIEGIIFVTLVVLIFMLDWRTTVIVAVIIPLSLLFAFICMRLRGMPANLLSMGAIDFGIIVDGAVIMVEGIFVVLDHKAQKLGMERYNKLIKTGMIKRAGSELGKSIFFSMMIMITALLPIVSFQKVEGKMFSPLAFTLGFALLGALLFTITLVPVLISVLLNKNVKEKHNPFTAFIASNYERLFNITFLYKKLSFSIAFAIMVISFICFRFLGSEFLPHLNEGAIYLRASLPLSTDLQESVRISQNMEKIITSFSEVKQVMVQAGRPNDGTDPTGFFNVEFHIDIFPKEKWKSKITSDQLITQMKAKLAIFPGIVFNFSQPIMDNVEEAVAGVKGSMVVKMYGSDFELLEQKADSIYPILQTVKGIEDLGIFRNIGQPELRIELDEQKMAAYGVITADCQAVIEMAIGGKVASQFYEGERKFDIRIRYAAEFRKTEKEIGKLMVPTIKGNLIPVKEIAKIRMITGPSFVYRENNQRYIAIKFSIRGRDMGSTIAEAQEKVSKQIQTVKGERIEWSGEFENQIRASKRLQTVIPISLLMILLLLFITFGNFRDAVLVLLNVPFAVMGGIFALLITQVNFSISAGVGFIALFGICIQNGVILTTVFKRNLSEGLPLAEAIVQGVKSIVRPVVMTATLGMIGLLPAALSTGIGSETQKPLAIVVIGGLLSTTILTLFIYPIIFEFIYTPHGKPFFRKNRKMA